MGRVEPAHRQRSQRQRPLTRSTVGAELGAAVRRLRMARVQTPVLDAEVLLGHVLRTSREFLRTYPEAPVTLQDRRRFRALVTRRASHVPVAYLVGIKEFYGHRLAVSPAVLIPRPETEILVERAIAFLRAHPTVRRVIDVGTGSGAIAIALASAVRRLRVDAVELDRRALRVARRNVRDLGLSSRIRVRQGDLLDGSTRVRCVVANLPYLSLDRRRHLPPDVRHEPVRALSGGRDGLDLIRRLLDQAPATLRAPGCLLLECDPAQARRVRGLATRAFPAARVAVLHDLSGRARGVEVLVLT
ncbi:MAG TPA: peptide chain release factor N(5)-glutamine methyltransferase [Candidatus Limnocylindrales bacterium]|nr:peptide chain release factor N(5)-glutamine methyltransferase [Candidatus Limnocylindrales bacterium]